MPIDRMESIRGLLVYVSSTYRNMKPYLKGVDLTMGSWKPYMNKVGWRMIVEKLKME